MVILKSYESLTSSYCSSSHYSFTLVPLLQAGNDATIDNYCAGYFRLSLPSFKTYHCLQSAVSLLIILLHRFFNDLSDIRDTSTGFSKNKLLYHTRFFEKENGYVIFFLLINFLMEASAMYANFVVTLLRQI